MVQKGAGYAIQCVFVGAVSQYTLLTYAAPMERMKFLKL